MSSMIKPARLKPGDTVFFMAPASHASEREIEQAKRRWNMFGYQVKLADNLGSCDGYFVGDIRQNVDAIHQAVVDPNVKALIALRGGYGSARLLPHLDYDLIKNNPKIFLGYSDITALLNAITTKTNLITYHGPVAKTRLTKTNRYYLNAVLSQNKPINLDSSRHINKIGQAPHTINPGIAHGQLIGGNLTVLNSMLNTEYLPNNWHNKILFLEDVGEDVYKIDRLLGQLQLAGILQQLAGIAFGQFAYTTAKLINSFSFSEVIERFVKPLKIPAISGAMFGHQATVFTLPIGAEVMLDAEKITLTT